MNCRDFDKVAESSLNQMSYDEQLEYKKNYINQIFGDISKDADIITSPTINFRCRMEFKIYHDGDNIFYAMTDSSKKFVFIDSCDVVTTEISTLMPKLLEELRRNEILKKRLFSVEFLSTRHGEVLVTLIYHKKIDEKWLKIATEFADSLDINIIGRSKKVKLITHKDYVSETLEVDGNKYEYLFKDGSFIQPNTEVNEKMITWVMKNTHKSDKDFLELYCGHGNFTLPLSTKFRKTLATEISKTSIRVAIENLELNNITNIEFARLSAEEFTQALMKVRKFRRLEHIDLDSYDFNTILVDPPRSGVDSTCIKIMKNHEKIIYISCNPETLKRDLDILLEDYEVEKFAMFDQFVYTKHIECGVILHKKRI